MALTSALPVHASLPALRPEKFLEMRFKIDKDTLPPGVTAGYRFQEDQREPGLNSIGPTLYNPTDIPLYVVLLKKNVLPGDYPNTELSEEYHPHLKYVSGKVYSYQRDPGNPHIDINTGELGPLRAPIPAGWYEIKEDPRNVQAFNWRVLRFTDNRLSTAIPWGSGEINLGFYKQNENDYREHLKRKDPVSILTYSNGEPHVIKAMLTYHRPRMTLAGIGASIGRHFKEALISIARFINSFSQEG